MNHFDGGAWRPVSMLGVSMLAGVVALRQVRRMPSGLLNFDGQHWSFAGHQGRLQMCLDFQTVMLVRLVAAGHLTSWIWVQKHNANGQWRDVRRAVYSRAPTVSDGGEPTDTPAAASRSLPSR